MAKKTQPLKPVPAAKKKAATKKPVKKKQATKVPPVPVKAKKTTRVDAKTDAKPESEPKLTPDEKKKQKQREGGRFWLGNQMWKLRSKHGRDTLFESAAKLWEAACEYFQWCDDNPLIEIDYKGGFATKVEIPKMRAYTLQGLCLYLHCNIGYFNDFEKGLKEKGKDATQADSDFSAVITRIRETIFAQKFEGAAAGIFNSNIISRDLGLADKKEVESRTIVVETSEDDE